MDEPELQELARSYDSFTGPAQDARRDEFTRRNLGPDNIGETDDPASVHPQFVTLRRYRDLSEAIVARSLLESAGIPVHLRDEDLIRLDWTKSNFIGGIRLQVDDTMSRTPRKFSLSRFQIRSSSMRGWYISSLVVHNAVPSIFI